MASYTHQEHAMNRSAFRRTLVAATMLAASTAFAGADIVKCVDQDGHVMLTDAPCRTGSDTVALEAESALPVAESALPAAETEAEADGAPAPLPEPVRALAIEHVAVAPGQLRHDTWVKKPARARALAVDVATLKAAHASMQMFDNAAAALRHQRLAGIN
jgi:hypothetical protein